MNSALPADATGRGGWFTRKRAVWSGVLLAGILFGISQLTWVSAQIPAMAATPARALEITGAEAAPALTALSAVAVTSAIATALTSRWARWLTGPVLMISGILACMTTLTVLTNPGDAAATSLASETGLFGLSAPAHAMAAAWSALAPSLVLALLGLGVLVLGRHWKTTARYRSSPEQADVLDDPAATWDAQTRGDDPTA
ncbi:Trp biosynthesis-associated membrane protein [Devriesea agamarum]|uniref:Trp biosynthesis-associated membrane protein n=1 Tax=Devriesea agamarum TaxID=472569 RepID=UPI00071DA7D2|nr:Trp biosynthesis-associated membrane protein [Devriesea agamarum]